MKVTAVFCCSPSAQCRHAALPNASDGCLAKSHFTRRINAIACVYETNPGEPFPLLLSHYRLSTLQWVWRKSPAVAGCPRLSPISSPSITIVSVNLSPNGQSLLIWLWWLSVNGQRVFFWLFFFLPWTGPASVSPAPQLHGGILEEDLQGRLSGRQLNYSTHCTFNQRWRASCGDKICHCTSRSNNPWTFNRHWNISEGDSLAFGLGESSRLQILRRHQKVLIFSSFLRRWHGYKLRAGCRRHAYSTYWCIQEALAVHSQIEFGLHPLDGHHSQAHWNEVEHGWGRERRGGGGKGVHQILLLGYI